MTVTKGVRRRIYSTGQELTPREMSEAIRDLDNAVTEVIPRKIIRTTIVYVPPFYLAYDHSPEGITLIRVRLVDDPVSIVTIAGRVQWDWTGTQIRVTSVSGATTNVRYDMTFEVIG